MPTAASTAMAMRSATITADRMPLISPASPKSSRDDQLLGRRNKHLFDMVPVDQVVEERLDIVGTTVAVVDVIGMFPHIAAENGRAAMHQRVLAVRSLGDGKLAALDLDPGPARAELADASRREVGFHLLDTAEILVDRGLELGGNLVAAAVRLHPLPELPVVVVLAGIVEEAGVLAERAFDDLLERFALKPAADQQLVAVVDIGLVVLVVVIFERLARHVGRQLIIGIGQLGQRERHQILLDPQTMIGKKAGLIMKPGCPG